MIAPQIRQKTLSCTLPRAHPKNSSPKCASAVAFTVRHERLSPWAERTRKFRNEGFYERFAAEGQVERVARIHRELGRSAGIAPRARA